MKNCEIDQMELAQEDVVMFANALDGFSDSPKDMLQD